MTLALLVISFVALIISLSTHEYSHALAAFLLGDKTAQRAGRLTLNPAAHVDPVGTIIIPLVQLVGALAGTPVPIFGWAKPVPFNPYNLKHGKWGAVIVALAGPVSNFAMAFVYLMLLRLVLLYGGFAPTNMLVLFLTVLVMINVVLGVFNFIPVPPLDGSKLLHAVWDKPQHRERLIWLETRGPMLLMGIILIDFILPVSILGAIFSTAIGAVFAVGGL
ncbi:site-2 protease family protein [Patescibacteria group bacterium]